MTFSQPLIRMDDAAWPPGMSSPAVAGYIGGAAAHVWTREEWDRFPDAKKLPVFVASGAVTGKEGDPEGEAFQCLRALRNLRVPKQAVALDMEMAVQPGYVRKFGGILAWAGYFTWVYGSKDFVFKNPALHGYWVADYTGVPHIAAGEHVRATQWEAGATFDQSDVKWWAFTHRLTRW